MIALVLRSRNPTTPQEVIGNMASIFAQSGKMTRAQAEGSYTFEVPNSLGFGLFVPTYFQMRAPFQKNGSNVYHVLHGTTNKGASLILAEELIRPGDFTINKNLAKCGYPSYGFYSAGEVGQNCPILFQPQGVIPKDLEDWKRNPASSHWRDLHWAQSSHQPNVRRE